VRQSRVCLVVRLSLPSIHILQGFTNSETDSIPMDLLARQDPVLDKIIFYDDVSLFEDELHDNGESVMNVRIVSDCLFTGISLP
jgi:hypothetical protein